MKKVWLSLVVGACIIGGVVTVEFASNPQNPQIKQKDEFVKEFIKINEYFAIALIKLRGEKFTDFGGRVIDSTKLTYAVLKLAHSGTLIPLKCQDFKLEAWDDRGGYYKSYITIAYDVRTNYFDENELIGLPKGFITLMEDTVGIPPGAINHIIRLKVNNIQVKLNPNLVSFINKGQKYLSDYNILRKPGDEFELKIENKPPIQIKFLSINSNKINLALLNKSYEKRELGFKVVWHDVSGKIKREYIHGVILETDKITPINLIYPKDGNFDAVIIYPTGAGIWIRIGLVIPLIPKVK